MKKLLCCMAMLLLSASLFAAPSSRTSTGQKRSRAESRAAKAERHGKLTRQLVEAYFKRMFGYDPEMAVTVIRIAPSPIPSLTAVTVVFSTPRGQQADIWYVSKDLKHAIVGQVLPFGAKPFAPVRAKLAKSAFGPAAGPAGAKLLMVEFADPECPACRRAEPVMDRLRKDFPQARFVFQSFPLPQHPWAARAASYVDCIGRRNPQQAFTFIDSIYTNQREIEEEVRKTDAEGKVTIDEAAVARQLRHYAQQAGADPDKIASCAASPETEGRLIRSEELGKSVGVNSTPTLFVNGRRIANIQANEYDSLKQLVSYEAQQAAAGN